jgi:outer membrane protein TolC
MLQIDFKEAIDRGLRNNLGLLLAEDQAQTARGARWKQLAELLPNIGARAQEAVQTQSLTALGLKPSVFHAPVPRVIGPFNYFDLRASLSQSLFSFKALQNY